MPNEFTPEIRARLEFNMGDDIRAVLAEIDRWKEVADTISEENDRVEVQWIEQMERTEKAEVTALRQRALREKAETRAEKAEAEIYRLKASVDVGIGVAKWNSDVLKMRAEKAKAWLRAYKASAKRHRAESRGLLEQLSMACEEPAVACQRGGCFLASELYHLETP